MDLKMMIFFINKKDLLDQLLAKLIDLGIGGATVIDSTGIGRSKIEDVLLYQGFKDVLRGSQKNNYTVMCIVKKKKINKVAKEVEKIYGGFKERGIGFFCAMPLDNVWGIRMSDE